jgi:hypothetical protein
MEKDGRWRYIETNPDTGKKYFVYDIAKKPGTGKTEDNAIKPMPFPEPSTHTSRTAEAMEAYEDHLDELMREVHKNE